MLQAEANLQRLAGGLRVKARVQHPGVKPRKDRAGWPWIFRYYDDEIQPDGSVKVLRRYHEIGPSKGDRTRHSLLVAGIARFARDGFRGTSVADVTHELDLKRQWDQERNPKSALDAWLATKPPFDVDQELSDRLILSDGPGGYLRRR